MKHEESVYKTEERCLKIMSYPQDEHKSSRSTKPGAMTPIIGAIFFLLFDLALATTDPTSGMVVCGNNYRPVCGSNGRTYTNACYARLKFWPGAMPKVGFSGFNDLA